MLLRQKITIGVVLVVVTATLVYIYGLITDIATRDVTIGELNKSVLDEKLNVANREHVIDELSNNITYLRTTIDVANAKVRKKEEELLALRKEYDRWKLLPPKEKYIYIYKDVVDEKVDYNKSSCEDGLKLNENISRMKYDSL